MKDEHIAGITLMVAILILAVVLLLRYETRGRDRAIAKQIADRESNELTKSALEDEHERTRQHITNIVGGMRLDTIVTKTRAQYVVDIVKKLAKAFGVTPPPL